MINGELLHYLSESWLDQKHIDESLWNSIISNSATEAFSTNDWLELQRVVWVLSSELELPISKPTLNESQKKELKIMAMRVVQKLDSQPEQTIKILSNCDSWGLNLAEKKEILRSTNKTARDINLVLEYIVGDIQTVDTAKDIPFLFDQMSQLSDELLINLLKNRLTQNLSLTGILLDHGLDSQSFVTENTEVLSELQTLSKKVIENKSQSNWTEAWKLVKKFSHSKIFEDKNEYFNVLSIAKPRLIPENKEYWQEYALTIAPFYTEPEQTKRLLSDCKTVGLNLSQQKEILKSTNKTARDIDLVLDIFGDIQTVDTAQDISFLFDQMSQLSNELLINLLKNRFTQNLSLTGILLDHGLDSQSFVTENTEVLSELQTLSKKVIENKSQSNWTEAWKLVKKFSHSKIFEDKNEYFNVLSIAKPRLIPENKEYWQEYALTIAPFYTQPEQTKRLLLDCQAVELDSSQQKEILQSTHKTARNIDLVLEYTQTLNTTQDIRFLFDELEQLSPELLINLLKNRFTQNLSWTGILLHYGLDSQSFVTENTEVKSELRSLCQKVIEDKSQNDWTKAWKLVNKFNNSKIFEDENEYFNVLNLAKPRLIAENKEYWQEYALTIAPYYTQPEQTKKLLLDCQTVGLDLSQQKAILKKTKDKKAYSISLLLNYIGRKSKFIELEENRELSDMLFYIEPRNQKETIDLINFFSRIFCELILSNNLDPFSFFKNKINDKDIYEKAFTKATQSLVSPTTKNQTLDQLNQYYIRLKQSQILEDSELKKIFMKKIEDNYFNS